MGWNQGYTIFEATVVGAYDLGVLTPELLAVLMEPYRNTDIDSGGCRELRSKDGLDVEEIVVKTFGGQMPLKPSGPTRYEDQSKAQRDAWDRYWDARCEAFDKIRKRFGWA